MYGFTLSVQQNGQEFREALWQLEESSEVFLRLPRVEMLRFVVALHEEAASKLAGGLSGVHGGCQHEREEAKGAADVEGTAEVCEDDTAGDEAVTLPTRQLASSFSPPSFSASPCSPAHVSSCPSFLFSLRFLPELAAAEDHALDSLSPRLNLLLLLTVYALSQGLRSLGQAASSRGASGLSSKPGSELTNTSECAKVGQLRTSSAGAPAGCSAGLDCFDRLLWESVPPAARRAWALESPEGQADLGRHERTLRGHAPGSVQHAGRYTLSARDTAQKVPLAREASKPGGGQQGAAKAVEERLQAFAEAVARAGVSRAVDSTVSDILLGLIAVARLEAEEVSWTGLFGALSVRAFLQVSSSS